VKTKDDSFLKIKISVFRGQKQLKEIEVTHGTNLRTALLKAGLSPYVASKKIFNCRGLGICGTCQVFIKQDNQWWERRSCQIQCFHPIEIQLK